jgi:hypothetical protein
MKNFTFKLSTLLLLISFVFTAKAQEWNISSASFNALGTISTKMTVEGLTIYGVTGAEVVVDANNKTLDGMSFTSRLKLGGTGAFDTEGKPVSRVLAFSVTGSTTITVMGMSSSSSADRELIIAAGNKDTIIGRFPALGASIGKDTYNYTGKATTIYLYSPSSGVNLYYIKSGTATSINETKRQELRVYPNPSSDKIYVDVAEPTQLGIYNLAGTMVLQKKVNTVQDNIDVSNFVPGVYFVRSLTRSSETQRFVVK